MKMIVMMKKANKIKGMNIMKIISLLLVVTTWSLYAAQIPNISDITKEVKPPKIEKKKEILPPLEKESDAYKISFKDGKKVLIRSFSFSGNTKISTQNLQSILKAYEDKNLSFKEIQDLVRLLTKEYRDQGYFLARAYIPTQDLQQQNAVLQIAIVEGEYGEFKLQNNSIVKDSILQAHLDSIKANKVIALQDLQRALLLINDTPSVKVSSTQVSAGEEIGTSDFIIGTTSTQRYNGYIIGDNYGSDYTGKYRLMAGMDINSPFKIGDKISVSALSSQDLGLLNGRVAYEFPLYIHGLRAEISYSKTSYELGSSYEDLDAIGGADSLVASVTYPMIRSTNENLNTYLRVSYNKMIDEIQANLLEIEKNTLVSKLGVTYEYNQAIFDTYSQTKLDTSLTFGKLNFKDDADKADDEAGANTYGNFSKVNIELQNNTLLTKQLSWKNKLQFQYALGNKNLDGSEDLSIGGVYGVRLYPASEENAENGYIYNTELIYNLPAYANLSSKLGVFYDIAKVKMSQNITAQSSRTLQDIGLSYYGIYKDFFLNAHFAHKLGGETIESEDDYDALLLLQAGWFF